MTFSIYRKLRVTKQGKEIKIQEFADIDEILVNIEAMELKLAIYKSVVILFQKFFV